MIAATVVFFTFVFVLGSVSPLLVTDDVQSVVMLGNQDASAEPHYV